MTTIQLKPGVELTRDDNHHGLPLSDWERLDAGLPVEVESVPDGLAALVDEVVPAGGGEE